MGDDHVALEHQFSTSRKDSAAELNGRPRKTLGWETSAERLAKLLALAS